MTEEGQDREEVERMKKGQIPKQPGFCIFFIDILVAKAMLVPFVFFTVVESTGSQEQCQQKNCQHEKPIKSFPLSCIKNPCRMTDINPAVDGNAYSQESCEKRGSKCECDPQPTQLGTGDNTSVVENWLDVC